MEDRNNVRLYNILFPVWMLIWWPSALWLILIPLNYLIDTLVFHLSLPKDADRRSLRRRYSWKLCLAGFLSDFAGSALLFGASALADADRSPWRQAPWRRQFVNDIAYNPFGSAAVFGVTLLAVALAGLLIFLLDRQILKKSGLGPGQAKRSALMLALITAPYLFFFPSGLLYR